MAPGDEPFAGQLVVDDPPQRWSVEADADPADIGGDGPVRRHELLRSRRRRTSRGGGRATRSPRRAPASTTAAWSTTTGVPGRDRSAAAVRPPASAVRGPTACRGFSNRAPGERRCRRVRRGSPTAHRGPGRPTRPRRRSRLAAPVRRTGRSCTGRWREDAACPAVSRTAASDGLPTRRLSRSRVGPSRAPLGGTPIAACPERPASWIVVDQPASTISSALTSARSERWSRER